MKVLLLVVLLLAVLVAAPGGARAAAPDRAVWPLDPRPEVVAGFDPPGSAWGAGHRGVDLLGHPGQDVRAALAGTVTFAGTLAGRGVVVVDHGRTRTTYEPVAAVVAVGTPVGAGAVIGRLQAGLSHCFPRTCLHWGLIEGERYLDPLSLLGTSPVRLLPLGPLPMAPPPVDLNPVTMSPLALLSRLTPWGEPAGRPFAAVPR